MVDVSDLVQSKPDVDAVLQGCVQAGYVDNVRGILLKSTIDGCFHTGDLNLGKKA